MRSVCTAWLASGIVAVLAILVMKALAPETEHDEPVDEYAQALRIHLPWLLSNLLMAFVAGSHARAWSGGWSRFLVALPVPVIAMFAAAWTGARAPETVPAAVLSLIETVLGVVLGVFLAGILAANREPTDTARSPEGELWRKSRWG
jgi:hypothetical protein